jgi:hypothetical protein
MVCVGFFVENNLFSSLKEVLFNKQTEVYQYRYIQKTNNNKYNYEC